MSQSMVQIPAGPWLLWIYWYHIINIYICWPNTNQNNNFKSWCVHATNLWLLTDIGNFHITPSQSNVIEKVLGDGKSGHKSHERRKTRTHRVLSGRNYYLVTWFMVHSALCFHLLTYNSPCLMAHGPWPIISWPQFQFKKNKADSVPLSHPTPFHHKSEISTCRLQAKISGPRPSDRTEPEQTLIRSYVT